MYKAGDSYYKLFITSNPSTGAAANADSTPVATANRNGTDDGTFSLTVTNIDAGRYKITGTVPGGYAAGDVVNVSVAATCSGVAGKGVVDTFQLDGRAVTISLAQALNSPRDISTVADTSLTLNDALHAALCEAAGQETVAGTVYTKKTPTGTTLRIFAFDNATNPTSRT